MHAGSAPLRSSCEDHRSDVVGTHVMHLTAQHLHMQSPGQQWIEHGGSAEQSPGDTATNGILCDKSTVTQPQ